MNEVRIIGGKWKRRKLRFPNRPTLRPTPDRARVTLFNWLAPSIEGAHCLDAFAGSGALGFEALSRGAASATLLDDDPLVVGALRENEAYAITLQDITVEDSKKLVTYVTDTKLIVPPDFLPNDSTPHVIRWFVVAVRQTGTDTEGNPQWDTAGAPSDPRVFSWLNTMPLVTPTP